MPRRAAVAPPALPPSLANDEGRQALRRALATWFRANRRDLPWRRAPSLYRTVVSEFMLQQTQVATVLPYFDRWMRELPDFAALAAAPEDRVLKLWEGLGYYSRARNLHRLAQAVATDGVPGTTAGWLALPGVGPYAAAAISSIAQGLPAAVVDGNVVRIVARLGGDATEYPNASAAVKAAGPVARALLDEASPGQHNEAMMELGATVCLKARPLCLLCPVRRYCAAGPAGTAESLPRIGRPKTERVTVQRAWIRRNGALLLAREDGDSRRLAGCWELPLRDRVAATGWKHLARRSRGISNQRITEEIFVAEPPGALPNGLEWVDIKALDAIRLSGPHRRWITELLAQG